MDFAQTVPYCTVGRQVLRSAVRKYLRHASPIISPSIPTVCIFQNLDSGLLHELVGVLDVPKAERMGALATASEHERGTLSRGCETPGKEGKKGGEGPKNQDAVACALRLPHSSESDCSRLGSETRFRKALVVHVNQTETVKMKHGIELYAGKHSLVVAAVAWQRAHTHAFGSALMRAVEISGRTGTVCWRRGSRRPPQSFRYDRGPFCRGCASPIYRHFH